MHCATGDALEAILRQTEELERLDVTHCPRVDHFGGVAHCRRLRELRVTRTTQICDEDLQLVSGFGQLRCVRLCRCFNITNRTVQALVECCPDLGEVNRGSGPTT